jgi:hypothetical protein
MAAGEPGLIEIRLTRASQLFNSFDPTPFPGRDLDDDAEEFIVSWAQEFRHNEDLRIVVHLPATECETDAAGNIAPAVSKHFEYRIGVMRHQLAELFRQGRLYLLVGLTIFIVCLGAAQILREAFPGNAVAGFAEQGLAVVGWVANWKPFEMLLYDWWPLRRRIRLFQRLARAPLIVSSV